MDNRRMTRGLVHGGHTKQETCTSHLRARFDGLPIDYCRDARNLHYRSSNRHMTLNELQSYSTPGTPKATYEYQRTTLHNAPS